VLPNTALKRTVEHHGRAVLALDCPLAITLPKRYLDRMARLGIELRITVYPYRAINEGI
jgi:hypothetical protein